MLHLLHHKVYHYDLRPYLLWYILLYTERVHLCSATLINCTYFLLAGFLLMWKRGTWIHGSGLLRYALELPPLPLCGSMSADASTKGFAGPVHFILLCRLNIFSYTYSLMDSEHTFVWQCDVFVPPLLTELTFVFGVWHCDIFVPPAHVLASFSKCDSVTYLSPPPYWTYLCVWSVTLWHICPPWPCTCFLLKVWQCDIFVPLP